MARRKLTEEEIERISQKKWKVTPVFTTSETLARRIRNLTGPKTVEGKMRSLRNLEVGRNRGDETTNLKHGGYVRKILNEEEQEYYMNRREAYLKDYDINESADAIMLHQVLMEEVILFRLYRQIGEKPSLKLDRPLNDASNRLSKALDSLGALRKQRLKQDEKASIVSIASIAQQFAKELSQGAIKMEIEKQREEEKKFLEEKQKREADREIEIESQYTD